MLCAHIPGQADDRSSRGDEWQQLGPDRWHDQATGARAVRLLLRAALNTRCPTPCKITSLVEFSASLAISRNALTGAENAAPRVEFLKMSILVHLARAPRRGRKCRRR